MPYRVNEIFYSLQGEGYWTGRPAVFIRFSLCNLWTGREEDRSRAVCKFCDTDFLHGDKYELEQLVAAVHAAHTPPGRTWTEVKASRIDRVKPMIVFTGGEPSLQVDEQLINSLHDLGYYLAIETNGTRELNEDIDWVCVSPKPAPLETNWGDELKLVYPQSGLEPELFDGFSFDHFWLSPMDGPDLHANTASAIEYCLAHPRWRLNIQTHKVIGVR